jgi:hypothetical protein
MNNKSGEWGNILPEGGKEAPHLSLLFHLSVLFQALVREHPPPPRLSCKYLSPQQVAAETYTCIYVDQAASKRFALKKPAEKM